MPRQVRHDRKQGREFMGERDAQFVVRFFNSEEVDRGSKKRVHEIVTKIRELHQAVEQTPDLFVLRREAGMVVITTSSGILSDALAAINVKLNKYLTAPMFLLNPSVRSRLSVGQSLPGKPSAARSHELLVVHSIVRIADAGVLKRLQACACGKWYFARFSHQRFCSPECRVTFWESSDERKEQKRKLARQYYLHHKVHPKGKRR